MNDIAFPCEYERSIVAGRPGVLSDEPLMARPGLRDLLKSDENFLSMLEAIHYMSFPGW
jgi:hypothetical protein